MRNHRTKSIVVILDADALSATDPSIVARGYFYSSTLITDHKVPLCLGSNVSRLPKVRENICILKEQRRIIEELLLPENRPLNRVLFRQIIGSLPVLTEYHSIDDERNSGIHHQITRKKLPIDCKFVANCLEFVVSRRDLRAVVATNDKGVRQIIETTLNSLRMINSLRSQEVKKSDDLVTQMCENLEMYVLSEMSLLAAEPNILKKWISRQMRNNPEKNCSS